MHSKKTEKQIFHFVSESYPSFLHDCCQVKRSEGHNTEKKCCDQRMQSIYRCVLSTITGGEEGVPAKLLGRVTPRKPWRVKNTLVWVESLLRSLETHGRESTSGFIKLQGHGGEGWKRAVNASSHHQRAATCAVWEQGILVLHRRTTNVICWVTNFKASFAIVYKLQYFLFCNKFIKFIRIRI